MSVFSSLLISIVIILLSLRLGSSQSANGIGCYTNADVETITEKDQLSLLTGSDSDETCITRCQGTGASIAGVKLMEGTNVPGMCSCLTLRPGAYINLFSCCKGKAKLKIASFGYKVYNISIHNKSITTDHYYSTRTRNELCDGTPEEIQSDSEEHIKLTEDFQDYNTTEIFTTFTLDDQKNLVFCQNNEIDTKREVNSSVIQIFDALFIPGSESSSKMCKLHCVLKSRLTKHSYKYFTVTTDNDENLEFCDCFREFPVALRSIQQCPQCSIDKSDNCVMHNVTNVVYSMESPSNLPLTSTNDGNNNPTNEENNGLSVGWIVFIIVSSVLVVICFICIVVLVAKSCYVYHTGNREWKNMFCCMYMYVIVAKNDWS